jgi:hypothetical protein
MHAHSLRAATLLCLGAWLAGCTVFLLKSDTQCQTDADCASRFPGASTTCSAGLCVTTTVVGGNGVEAGTGCVHNSDCSGAIATSEQLLCVHGTCTAANTASCQVLNPSLLSASGAQPLVIGLLVPSGVPSNGVFVNPTTPISGAINLATATFNAAAEQTGASADVRQEVIVQCDEANPTSLAHLLTVLDVNGIIGPFDDTRALAAANAASTAGDNQRGVPVFSPFANAESVAGTGLWSAAPNRSLLEPVFTTLLAAAKAHFRNVDPDYTYSPVTLTGDQNDVGGVELFNALQKDGALPGSPAATLPDILYASSTATTQYQQSAQEIASAVTTQPTTVTLESGMLDSYDVLYDLENTDEDDARLPFYVTFQLSSPFLTNVATDNPSASPPHPYMRTLAIDFERPPGSVAIQQALAQQATASFQWGAEYAYDAFFALSYALYAARSGGKNDPSTVTLTQFALGMQAVTQGGTTACTSNGNNGSACPVDGAAEDILRELSVGGSVQLTGASGSLDYSDPTGKLSIKNTPNGKVAIYCLTGSGSGAYQYTDSGFHAYASAAPDASVPVTTEGTVCCPGVEKATCP